MDQFSGYNIAVLVKFLGQRQELIGREEGSRRHRYYSSARVQSFQRAGFQKTHGQRKGKKGVEDMVRCDEFFLGLAKPRRKPEEDGWKRTSCATRIAADSRAGIGMGWN